MLRTDLTGQLLRFLEALHVTPLSRSPAYGGYRVIVDYEDDVKPPSMRPHLEPIAHIYKGTAEHLHR